jgi:dipeptidyl aminopeptidase/acylaminoacyl peptidase
MKMILKHRLILCALIVFLVISCESISVSVNSKGQIAFTRSEGTFYLDFKTGKLSVLDWNKLKDAVPAIVRWAPDNETIAFTVRDSANSQDTTLYLIDKKKEKKKLYSTTNAITQIEWSTDGNYVTVAQGGSDSEMSVADIELISIKDGMSKLLGANTGDVHKWIDGKTVAFIKLTEKNKDNSDMLKGTLATINVTSSEIKDLSDIIVSKTMGIDYSPARNEIVFTAIKAGKDAAFEAEMKSDSFIYIYNLKKGELSEPLESLVADYVKMSPDGSRILLKSKDADTSLYNLCYYDIKGKKIETLVANTLNTVTTNSFTAQVCPTWFDNTTVLFWRMNSVYGANGQSIQLFSINLSTMKKQNHQLIIENEIAKLVEKNGGY